jgi:hypothetical protein
VKKHNFDQTPILLENFDQVIRSSEIRSSDPLSVVSIQHFIFKLGCNSTILINTGTIFIYNNLDL